MKAVIHNAEVRGKEVKQGQRGNFLIVRYEDETGKPEELRDDDMERESYYRRGVVMDFTIDIRQGRTREGKEYTNIRIIDAREVKS